MQARILAKGGAAHKGGVMKNHRLRVSLANKKIVLDNPFAYTYHTAVLCQRFDLKRPENSREQQGQPRSRFS